MITPKNLIWHELIGLQIEIIENKNEQLVGLKGKIIDETKNMIIIKSKEGEKKIIKKDSKFKIRIDEKNILVDGSLIVGRPEKRTKKKLPKKRV